MISSALFLMVLGPHSRCPIVIDLCAHPCKSFSGLLLCLFSQLFNWKYLHKFISVAYRPRWGWALLTCFKMHELYQLVTYQVWVLQIRPQSGAICDVYHYMISSSVNRYGSHQSSPVHFLWDRCQSWNLYKNEGSGGIWNRGCPWAKSPRSPRSGLQVSLPSLFSVLQ